MNLPLSQAWRLDVSIRVKSWTFRYKSALQHLPACVSSENAREWGRTIFPLAQVHNCLSDVYQKMHSHFHKTRYVGLQEDIRKPPCTFFRFLELNISSSVSLNRATVLLPTTSFHVLWHLIPEVIKSCPIKARVFERLEV